MSRVPVILLKVLSGPDSGQEKRFNQYCVRLGRDYRNDFVLTDRFVSGRHGKLVWESGTLIYYDLQSRHGTTVSTILVEGDSQIEKSARLQDPQKVSRHEVTNGAQMLLGSTLLHLKFENKRKDEDTFEEHSIVQGGLEEVSLMPMPHGELTLDRAPAESSAGFATPDSNPHMHIPLSSSSHDALHPVGRTRDFLPAHPTSAPQTETLYYQQPFSAYSSPDTPTTPPPVPLDGHTGTLPDDLPSGADHARHKGLEVPGPGQEPGPAPSVLRPSSFKDHPGGALSENIRQGLTKTLTDVDVEHLLVGGTGAHGAWGTTQSTLPSFNNDKISIDAFPDEDISKYATADAASSTEAFSKSIDKKDPRLEMLFRLAGQLNQLNHIDDILSLIVESTFDTLRAAQFFSLCLLNEEGEFVPYLTRMPGSAQDTEEKVTLSQSLLREVAEKREAVLFVRDRNAQLSQSIIDAEIWSCLCAPLIGQRTLLGVMLIDTRQKGSLFTPQDLNLFSVLASSAAFALERAQLTAEIVRMFEGFVDASVTAIEARDPTTAGHSQRVATYTIALAEAVNDLKQGDLEHLAFTREELVELRYAALLHDMGKVGVKESVLNKASRLTDETMSLIHQRFETFKAFSSQIRYEALFQRLQKDKRPPTDDELLEIRVAQEKLNAELNEIFQWINTIRRSEYLPDEVMERLEQLSSRQVTLGEHQRVPLLSEEELQNLRIRRGTLNDQEWENMRSHAALSESYLELIPWSADLKRIPCIAGAHHEKLDGSGYPQGLKGEELLPQVRILTIADIFDALTAWDRPYRKAASIEKAMRILDEESSAGKLDRYLVRAFAEQVVPKLSLPQQQEQQSEALIKPEEKPSPTATGDYSLFMPKS